MLIKCLLWERHKQHVPFHLRSQQETEARLQHQRSLWGTNKFIWLPYRVECRRVSLHRGVGVPTNGLHLESLSTAGIMASSHNKGTPVVFPTSRLHAIPLRQNCRPQLLESSGDIQVRKLINCGVDSQQAPGMTFCKGAQMNAPRLCLLCSEDNNSEQTIRML